MRMVCLLSTFNFVLLSYCTYFQFVSQIFKQDHLSLGELKKLLNITNIPLIPLLARGIGHQKKSYYYKQLLSNH